MSSMENKDINRKYLFQKRIFDAIDSQDWSSFQDGLIDRLYDDDLLEEDLVKELEEELLNISDYRDRLKYFNEWAESFYRKPKEPIEQK